MVKVVNCDPQDTPWLSEQIRRVRGEPHCLCNMSDDTGGRLLAASPRQLCLCVIVSKSWTHGFTLGGIADKRTRAILTRNWGSGTDLVDKCRIAWSLRNSSANVGILPVCSLGPLILAAHYNVSSFNVRRFWID